MYRRRYALTLLWTDSHSSVGTFVGADLNLSRSSASWSVRIASMIPDQFTQSDPSNCSSLIPVGIPKVDVYALLTRSLGSGGSRDGPSGSACHGPGGGRSACRRRLGCSRHGMRWFLSPRSSQQQCFRCRKVMSPASRVESHD